MYHCAPGRCEKWLLACSDIRFLLQAYHYIFLKLIPPLPLVSPYCSPAFLYIWFTRPVLCALEFDLKKIARISHPCRLPRVSVFIFTYLRAPNARRVLPPYESRLRLHSGLVAGRYPLPSSFALGHIRNASHHRSWRVVPVRTSSNNNRCYV